MEETTTQAIKAAIDHDWETAIKLNKKLLAIDPNDDCLLRMAHAYFSKGDLKKATSYAQKALKTSPDNKLAKKILDKCKNTKDVKTRNAIGKVNLKAFVGTDLDTKLVKLVHTGTPSAIASLLAGESLVLDSSANKAHVETTEGVYVGRLPDDVATKIWGLRDKRTDAVVKSASQNNVTILLLISS